MPGGFEPLRTNTIVVRYDEKNTLSATVTTFTYSNAVLMSLLVRGVWLNELLKS